MGVALDHILMLTGRLDDTRGFDAPRERFRRFLREYVSDVKVARTLIEQCQHAPDEQHLRALEDLVVYLGRFLGFEVTFGSALPDPDGFRYQGTWQSQLRVHVVVEVRSALTAPGSAAGLVRAVASLRAAPPGIDTRVIGFSVLAPFSATRAKAEEAIAAENPAFPVSVAPLAELMSLAAMVVTGHVAHTDVVRVLESNLSVDFLVDVVERSTANQPADVSEQAPAGSPSDREGSGFWMASVASDYATTPEELLELVVGKRHVFGVNDKGPVLGTVRNGDWICFYLPGKGVVGHAHVASVSDSTSGIRDARRFRQVLRLESLALHLDRPLAMDPETELRLRAAPAAANRQTQILVEISRESFSAMTTRPEPDDVGSGEERLLG